MLRAFAEAAGQLQQSGVRFVFAGPPPMAERAAALGFFERVFDGTEPVESTLALLRDGNEAQPPEVRYPQTVIERLRWKSPFPLLRHHFGLATVDNTRRGIERISEAHALDVISLGTDQDAQANFFRPERQNPKARGAGGVPVRSADDYRSLYRASRRGNFPLMRTYSGTDDFIKLAELYVETINIAWCAIPLFWFNQMDGRGPWNLEESIGEHQRLMAWYGAQGIPVELNEPHHWGLRDAPDVLCVVAAYLSAYNARAVGVQDYIAQLMFNSPPGLSDAMDLAKMQACLQIIEPLSSEDFRLWRQTRTGLLSYPWHPAEARGHLASSIYLQMALRPHIVHVVGPSEADHAANAEEVIEACGFARRAIQNALRGAPDLTADPEVRARTAELLEDARITLEAIRSLAASQVEDPWTDPATLAEAVARGVLDAPHLRNNPFALGQVQTEIDRRGACIAIDPSTHTLLSEGDRLSRLGI